MDKRGKVTLTVLIISIILVGFFSLYFVLAQSDNTKEYDSINKIVTIKDSSGEVVSDITLNTPQINKIYGAYYQKVAEITIQNSGYDYEEIIKGTELYNVNDGMKEVVRNVDYKYKTINPLSCVNNGNKTNCSQEEFIWNDWNDNALLKGENITIGLFTEVKTGDHIEWISNLYGKRLTEWAEWVYSGFSFTASEPGAPRGLAWNGNSFFVIASTEDFVYEYLANGTYTGFNFTTNSENDNPFAMVWNGSGFFVTGSTGDEVNGYDSSGTYNGITFTVGSQDTNPYGIAWNGTHFYVTGNVNDRIYIYDSSGTYTGNNFYVGAEDTSPTGITWNGSSFFVVGDITDFVYEYWANGTYTGNSFNTGGETTTPLGITWNDSGLFVFGTSEKKVFEYILNISAVIPSINVFSPLNQSYSTSTIYFNATSDVEIDTWIVNYNGTNVTVTINSTLEVEDGFHNLFLYANSTSGFFGLNDTIYFTVDTTLPQTTQLTINPLAPNSSVNLNCNATLTDNQQDPLTANWTWYKNNVSTLTGVKTEIINNTNTIITTLNSENTTKGEEWKCGVIPYDGFNYGNESNSSSVTILNSVPTHNNPLLTTPSSQNLSTQDLTCEPQNLFDTDGDSIVNITNWFKDNQTIFSLLMPFEINADDYSGNNNDGNISGAIPTTGKLGSALSFDGVDDFVSVGLSNFPNSEFTFEMWFNVSEFSSNGRDLFTKYSGGDGFRTLITSSGQIESAWDIGDTFNTLTTTGITTNTWHYFVVTYNGSLIALYLDGDLKDSEIDSGNLTIGINTLTIGFNDLGTPNFNGSIDEVRIYNTALTQEQIQANFNLNYNKIVSQETQGGDNYMCSVTPNDGEADGTTLNSSELNVLWAIEFNVTDSFSKADLSGVTISCNSTGFNQNDDSTPNTNPYGLFGFSPGSYSCTFERTEYFDKTQIFTADDDKVINVRMSEFGGLTIEEHTWLEAIYNCIKGGDCSLYNLLLQVNSTVTNIWEQTKPTDESVIISEVITNRVVNSTNNLTINYSVNIPIKAGYSPGAYLPVRIGFWFMDTANTTCYNQGERPVGVSDPYCQPLIVETIGPMGGSVNFTVELQPSLPTGNYSIKRIIDIDPLGVWYNYGQEIIGTVTMLESLANFGVSISVTGDSISNSESNSDDSSSSSSGSGSSSSSSKKTTNVYNTYNTIEEQQSPSEDGVIYLNAESDKSGNSRITGGVIGAGGLLGWQIIFVITVIGLLLVVFIVSRTKLRLKEK